MCARGLPGLKSPTTGEDFATKTAAGPRWTGEVEVIESALEIPLRWRRPRKVFLNSMSDTFHERVPDEWIDMVFGVMALCREHTFICPTKRVKRAQEWFSRRPQRWSDGSLQRTMPGFVARKVIERMYGTPQAQRSWTDGAWPLPNVIILSSVSTQADADRDIPELLATPAACRGISLEPMLGPVDLRRWLPPIGGGPQVNLLRPWEEPLPPLKWVIVGGESGPGARSCNIEWTRDIVRQCREAGVKCFVKQMGANPMEGSASGNCRNPACTHPDCGWQRLKLRDRAGADPAEWPEDLRVQQWPEVRR